MPAIISATVLALVLMPGVRVVRLLQPGSTSTLTPIPTGEQGSFAWSWSGRIDRLDGGSSRGGR